RPGVFLPYSLALATADRADARSLNEMSIVLRCSPDPRMLVAPANEIVRKLDPDVPMFGVQTMREGLDRFLLERRVYSWLVGGFAAVAVLLAGAGVCGTVSFGTSRRTREIGIRIALGAPPRQVLFNVLLNGMQPVAIGVAVGAIGALWAARLLGGLLFNVSSSDLPTYCVVALFILGVGFAANLLPARRAAMIDPISALRSE